MSATDELRRLLDELRKLACDINEEEIRSHSIITLNQGRYNRQFRLDMNHDWLNAWHAEFERILQAIDATLGVETCHNKSKWTNVFNCSACGFEYDFVTNPYQGPRYCPNCGRKVVGDG